MRARSILAPSPLSTKKPLPATFTPRWKSMMSRSSPRAMWSLGWKSKSRTLPNSMTMRFFS